MKITKVEVRKVDSETHMRGFASVYLDDCFVVHVRIIEGNNGLFAAMPSRRSKSGEEKDTAHPITQECREMFNKAVAEAYMNAKDDETTEDYENADEEEE